MSVTAGVLLASVALGLFTGSLPEEIDRGLKVELQRELRQRRAQESPAVAKSKRSWHALDRFYAGRGHSPLWVGPSGPNERATELISAIEHGCESEGLGQAPYGLASLSKQIAAGPADAAALARLELRLTRVALLHASHRLHGRIDPLQTSPRWRHGPREGEPMQLLEAIAEGAGIEEALGELDPRHDGYVRLKAALVEHRAIAAAGGWTIVPAGPPLKLGSEGKRVLALRARLRASGDLEGEDGEHPERYDEPLAEAVRRFQARHGLPEDGVAGGRTLNELRVPVEARIRQILVNLERWRWVPQELGERHVAVNVPDFSLRAVEPSGPGLEMKVVVGKDDRRTPLFSGAIEGLIVNPTWHLPRRIAAEKLLERAPKDPAWVSRNGYELYSQGKRLDPRGVDWSNLGARLPFQVTQRPGAGNALGRLKFEIPNPFQVYLHDTSQRGLFERSTRTMSSGCVRLEKPLALADFVLGTGSEWNSERIAEAMEAGKTVRIALPRPVPVHVFYWTSWVDARGRLQLRGDPYRADRDLMWRLGKLDRGWDR